MSELSVVANGRAMAISPPCTLDDFDIVAQTGRNLTKVQESARQFGIGHAFGSAEALIARADIDLVVVSAPTPEHGRLTKAVSTCCTFVSSRMSTRR